MPHFASSPIFISLALQHVSDHTFQRRQVSLSYRALDGFAVLAVDHGLIIESYPMRVLEPQVAPVFIGRWQLPGHEAQWVRDKGP